MRLPSRRPLVSYGVYEAHLSSCEEVPGILFPSGIARAGGFAGKACIRASVSRNEEIAFYLEEIKTYLQEIITYTKSVNQLSSLDKDRVKRIMNSTCDAFEHVATLIDANTAASGRNAVGQLTIQRENSGHNYANSYNPYPMG